ncbi:MAG TPA: hypothetical protein VN634_03025 [Candidatus Limnocylindrales bacterium]|nr:hypothetical protein [Candidatus Limnocylindrales bacterium]
MTGCNEDLSLKTIDLDCDTRAWAPEFKLMLAVMEDALVTFQYGLRSANPLRRRRGFEVESWVASTDSDSPFSFENICTTLCLDPQYIREGLLRMKRSAYAERCRIRRIRLRRQPAEGQRRRSGTIANDANESRRYGPRTEQGAKSGG